MPDMPAVSLVDAVESLGSAAAVVGVIAGSGGLQFAPGAEVVDAAFVGGSELPWRRSARAAHPDEVVMTPYAIRRIVLAGTKIVRLSRHGAGSHTTPVETQPIRFVGRRA
jgi:hypothetical protein